jgi:hypothetical protein
MTVYLSVQQKAQDELNNIIEKDRLLQIADQGRLLYIDTLIKELHCFNPIIPLIPHSTHIDDEYYSYRIPKNSWLMANSWYILW